MKQPNKLRRWLAKLLANTRGVIFSGHKSDEYVEELDASRFCIIPRGNTPWTRRFFDAAVRGRIPVVLSDPDPDPDPNPKPKPKPKPNPNPTCTCRGSVTPSSPAAQLRSIRPSWYTHA